MDNILKNYQPKSTSEPKLPDSRPVAPPTDGLRLGNTSYSRRSTSNPIPSAPFSKPAYNVEDRPVRPPEEPLEIKIEHTSHEDGESGVPNIDEMLRWMVENGGSDLFLSANLPPSTKIHGERVAVPGFSTLSDTEVESAMYSIISRKQRAIFEENKELDCSYSVPNVARFRVNIGRSKNSVFAVLRTIPFEIKPLSALGLPQSLNNYAKLPRGLVLVTGPTGSGKSTTLAAIIDEINRTQKGHILTIEDPIEFVHNHGGCIVNQREVGTDTESFQNALKAALREAPDYILVGEMRDYETISLAITMAETGHLVFGTLHTNSAPETISRIIDVFPADQQEQVKTQLAASLQAVVCQNLVRTKDGNGRVAVVEIMNTTQSIKAKIKKGQTANIISDLQLGKKYGMQTMDSHLLELAKKGTISVEVAVEKAHRPSDMIQAFGGEEEYAKIVESSNSRFSRR